MRLAPTDALLRRSIRRAGGDAHIQIHPDYRHLEPELVAGSKSTWPMKMTPAPAIPVHTRHGGDARRRRVLQERLFRGDGAVGSRVICAWAHRRYSRSSRPATPSVPPIPESPRDASQGIADIFNAAFNRTFHTAAEYQTFARLAPSFRAGLDFVATAPDGTIAALRGRAV
ncbi:MAG: hypothetical protein R2851_08405 [Caldilineaceae bacterium]